MQLNGKAIVYMHETLRPIKHHTTQKLPDY
jgi:hypothetical protein